MAQSNSATALRRNGAIAVSPPKPFAASSNWHGHSRPLHAYSRRQIHPMLHPHEFWRKPQCLSSEWKAPAIAALRARASYGVICKSARLGPTSGDLVAAGGHSFGARRWDLAWVAASRGRPTTVDGRDGEQPRPRHCGNCECSTSTRASRPSAGPGARRHHPAPRIRCVPGRASRLEQVARRERVGQGSDR